MGGRHVLLGAILLALTTAAASVGSISAPGTVRAHKTVSGQFAIASVSATVHQPRALYLQLIGNVNSGLVIVSCSKGFAISANSYTRNRAGVYSIPVRPANADSCQLTGSVGGSGRVTIALRST
jgi:hypothetical protein